MKKIGKNMKSTKLTVEAYNLWGGGCSCICGCSCGTSSVANVQVSSGIRSSAKSSYGSK